MTHSPSSPLTDAEWRARGEQVKAAHVAALARQPRCCPECGTPDPLPTFDPIDGYQCENPACCATWREEEG